MLKKPREDVMAVLPDRFGYHQRRFRINPREDIHAHSLAADESVFPLRVIRMSTSEPYPFRKESTAEHLFQPGLCFPANLIGGLTQIATRDQKDFICLN
jgi:hypothetical protein